MILPKIFKYVYLFVYVFGRMVVVIHVVNLPLPTSYFLLPTSCVPIEPLP